ncbi:hypothetical protein tb265_25500 [Gemmatimonadetes bacterium T265]|nr:hypothetical protein tb265_25500 [Gemmatimonadetes bacterium T265]
MQLAHAARILASARSLAALAPLAAAAGVDGRPTPLSRATLADAAFGDAGVTRARVATGPGALRALLADVRGPSLRDAARKLAITLSARSPELLWLLVLRDATADDAATGDAPAGDAGCGHVALAAWSPTPRGPQLVALVADPARIVDSDADTLRALAAAADPADALAAPGTDLRHHARWLDALGRDALGARFYRTLEHTVAALARSTKLEDTSIARELALLYTTRLLFLAFLQAKHWLDGDPTFLARRFDACMTAGGRYHDRVLRPLFFGTLNTPRRHRAPAARAFGRIPFLNGGLFSPTPLERRHRSARFGDAELGALVVTLLGRHRFTAREDSTAWSEAAVDPEMLGRAFESLMHAGDRRASGAFYTPRALVAHATDAALHAALPSELTDAALAGDALTDADAARLRAALTPLRILDPACGSGAFLVHALERVAALHTLAGDPRSTSELRRAVAATSIFGVDVNPTAVWLCELRLWLSVVIEHDEPDPYRVPPLPNLDHNVRVGDALAVPPALTPLTRHTWGGAPWGAPSPSIESRRPAAPAVTALRTRYASLAGPRKVAAARRLDALERAHALATFDRALAHLRHTRRELLAAVRTRDLFGARPAPDRATAARLAALRADVRALARRRAALAAGNAVGGALPFGFAWHFPDAAASDGFPIVLGNPPWVRPHALAADTRDALRTHYAAARDAPWRAGATLARAGQGFSAQADLAAPFTERALALARPGGVVAFLLPTKLWRTLAGGGVRAILARHADVLALDDWSDGPAAFDAVTYPSLLVARRHTSSAPRPATPPPAQAPVVTVPAHHRPRLPDPLDPADPASPWLLLPPDARDAFDRLRAAGPALGATALTRPTLGVKSGYNAAFLVELDHVDGPDAFVSAAGRHGTIERALLRPVLRGEDLAHADAPTATSTHVIWPYDADGHLLPALPPGVARWLAPARAQLAARSDARGNTPWWALFRTDAADPRTPRVVWPDLARTPHPRVLAAGDTHVPLNTCYVARFDDPIHASDDARAFAALLRSPPIAAWLAALAEPARGGYHRYLAWTVAALPVPPHWASARLALAHLPPTANADTLTRTVAAAYGVTPAALAPLLAWAGSARITTARPLRSALAEPAPPAWARRPRPDRRGRPAPDGPRPHA